MPRHASWRDWTGAGVLALIAVGVVLSFTGSPEPAEEPPPRLYKAGETVRVGAMSYNLSRAWWSDHLSSNQFLDHRPNGKFLFVEITVGNTGNQPVLLPEMHLVDLGGALHNSDWGDWVVDESHGIVAQLNPGISQRGRVAFDVVFGKKYKLVVSDELGPFGRESALIDVRAEELINP